jgi:hypothetical protein
VPQALRVASTMIVPLESATATRRNALTVPTNARHLTTGVHIVLMEQPATLILNVVRDLSVRNFSVSAIMTK